MSIRNVTQYNIATRRLSPDSAVPWWYRKSITYTYVVHVPIEIDNVLSVSESRAVFLTIVWRRLPSRPPHNDTMWTLSVQVLQRDRATSYIRHAYKDMQLRHIWTKNPICNDLQQVNDLEGHSRSSELSLFDWSFFLLVVVMERRGRGGRRRGKDGKGRKCWS